MDMKLLQMASLGYSGTSLLDFQQKSRISQNELDKLHKGSLKAKHGENESPPAHFKEIIKSHTVLMGFSSEHDNHKNMIHIPGNSGLDGMVFRDNATGQITISIAGTQAMEEPLDDVINADIRGIVANGVATHQVRDMQKVMAHIKKQPWYDGQKVNLVGHSLGGHVATMIHNLYPQMVGKTDTINAPGIGYEAAEREFGLTMQDFRIEDITHNINKKSDLLNTAIVETRELPPGKINVMEGTNTHFMKDLIASLQAMQESGKQNSNLGQTKSENIGFDPFLSEKMALQQQQHRLDRRRAQLDSNKMNNHNRPSLEQARIAIAKDQAAVNKQIEALARREEAATATPDRPPENSSEAEMVKFYRDQKKLLPETEDKIRYLVGQKARLGKRLETLSAPGSRAHNREKYAARKQLSDINRQLEVVRRNAIAQRLEQQNAFGIRPDELTVPARPPKAGPLNR